MADLCRFLQPLLVTGLALVAASCATVSNQPSLDRVSRAVADRTAVDLATSQQSQEAIASRTAELVAVPLTAQNAVELALLNSPGLRAQLEDLGIADADRVQAGLIHNPSLFGSIRFPSDSGAHNNVEWGVTQNLLDILVRPARTRLAEQDYQRAQHRVGDAIVGLITDVDAAYFAALGTQQIAAMTEKMLDAARVSEELAGRFREAGNVSLLELTLEQAAAAEAELALTRSRTDAVMAREHLQRLLGLPAGSRNWRLPDSLPNVPDSAPSLNTLLAQAFERRLDLAAARAESSVVAEALSTTRRWRWTSGVEVGINQERDTDGTRVIGPNLSVELPLFDRRQAAIARLEAQARQSQDRIGALEIRIHSEVEQGYALLQAQRAMATTYRDRLIPLRTQVVEQSQLEQNYMLIGIFQVLQAKQQEYDAYRRYLEATRDYWMAQAELSRAVGGGVGLLTASPGATK